MNQIMAMQNVLAGKHLISCPHRHGNRWIAPDQDGVVPDWANRFSIDRNHLEGIDVNMKGMVPIQGR